MEHERNFHGKMTVRTWLRLHGLLNIRASGFEIYREMEALPSWSNESNIDQHTMLTTRKVSSKAAPHLSRIKKSEAPCCLNVRP